MSVDYETGGKEKYVILDLISVTEENFVLIVEAKRSSLGASMKHADNERCGRPQWCWHGTISLRREKAGECSATMGYILRRYGRLVYYLKEWMKRKSDG